VIKFVSDSVTVVGRWFSPVTLVSSINKTDTPRYSWNIVESGSKHHKPTNLYNVLRSQFDYNVFMGKKSTNLNETSHTQFVLENKPFK
jgi:hypothetical protein